jgi:type I restriction enzyme S subunit
MKEAMEVLEIGFKETEIGLIPEDWEVVRLGKVVNFKIGKTPPRKNKDYWTDGKYYWVSISDMKNPNINNTSEMVSEKAHKEIFKEKLTPAGTLLMSFKLTIGRTAILNVDAYHNEAIISIYPKENKVLKEFLFYYLPAVDYSNLQDKVVKGNTLNTSKLNKIPIPLPPLDEQKAIVDILSAVQNAIEKTEKVINATKQLKKSLMKHLFTYGAVAVDEIDRVKLKESEIGLIPEHWEVVRLGEVVDLDRGISWRKFEEGNKDNGHLIISIPNIKDGYIDFNSKYNHYLIKHIPKNKQIQLNDILFVGSSGSIENVGRNVFIENLPFEGIGFASFVFRARVKVNTIIPKFLYFMANSHWFNYKDYVRRSSDGKYNFQLTEFKSIKIPLPPLDEQQKIANILTTIDQKIQAEEKKKEALQNLFKTLLYHLMTGKIRVKKAKT